MISKYCQGTYRKICMRKFQLYENSSSVSAHFFSTYADLISSSSTEIFSRETDPLRTLFGKLSKLSRFQELRQCVKYCRRTPVDDYFHSKLFFQYENFRRNKIQARHEFSCFGLFAKLFLERSKYNVFQSYEDIAGTVHSHLIFNNALSVLQSQRNKSALPVTKVYSQCGVIPIKAKNTTTILSRH